MIITGQKFGKLTTVKRARKENGKLGWLCTCDCGGTFIATPSSLSKGDNKSCGCSKYCGRTLKDMTGQVYGNLTVIKRSGSVDGSTTWLCKCICGNDRIVQRANLLYEKTISCGCINKVRNSNLPVMDRLFARYKYNASGERRRNMEFTLTQQEFENLVFKDCHYCGEPPFLKFKTAAETIIHGGIDRVDNSKGYHNDNCVPCCQHCNAMKLQLSYKDFIEKIHKIAKKHPIFTPVLT